ncbi:hypothetical protein C1645_830629, partial [Glomus cerebriforme]
QASEICEKDKYLETLKNETTCMQSNYRNLVNIISEKDQKFKQFEYNLESLKNISENDSSNHKIKISKNEVQLHVLQKVLKNKIEVCREYENKITSLENEINNFKKQIDKTQLANSEKTVKITRLEETNLQLKEEVKKLKQKMDEKEKELKLAKSKSFKCNSRKPVSYKSRKISDGSQLTHMRLIKERKCNDITSVSKRKVKPRILSSININSTNNIKRNVIPKEESSIINRSIAA